jgi:hypothetical protein
MAVIVDSSFLTLHERREAVSCIDTQINTMVTNETHSQRGSFRNGEAHIPSGPRPNLRFSVVP